jgi:flagellar biosynthetic protein FliR
MFTITTAELDAWIGAFVFPFFRLAAVAGTAPLLSHPSVPRRVRIGLALLLTVIVAPTLPATAPVSPFSAPGAMLLLQQVMIGCAIGFVMQFAFAAVTLAGDMIGLQMGLSFASLVDPQHAEQVPIIGGFLSVILMLVFTAMNGHLMMLAALADSFTAFPLRADVLAHLDWGRLAAGAGVIFASGLQIALPVIAALLLVSLALGVLTRTAPQLNLFAIGFPVTLVVGLLMLMLAMPYIMPALQHVFDDAFLRLPR